MAVLELHVAWSPQLWPGPQGSHVQRSGGNATDCRNHCPHSAIGMALHIPQLRHNMQSGGQHWVTALMECGNLAQWQP